jgi:hypothetical protein
MWLKIKARSVLARRASHSLTHDLYEGASFNPHVMSLDLSRTQQEASLHVASSLAVQFMSLAIQRWRLLFGTWERPKTPTYRSLGQRPHKLNLTLSQGERVDRDRRFHQPARDG